MRLIDVDALPKAMEYDYETGEMKILYYDAYVIANAPTVDAIPVEWIEDVYMKYMKTLKDSDNNPKSKKWFELRMLAYRMLIRDWRKENEINN